MWNSSVTHFEEDRISDANAKARYRRRFKSYPLFTEKAETVRMLLGSALPCVSACGAVIPPRWRSSFFHTCAILSVLACNFFRVSVTKMACRLEFDRTFEAAPWTAARTKKCAVDPKNDQQTHLSKETPHLLELIRVRQSERGLHGTIFYVL